MYVLFRPIGRLCDIKGDYIYVFLGRLPPPPPREGVLPENLGESV